MDNPNSRTKGTLIIKGLLRNPVLQVALKLLKEGNGRFVGGTAVANRISPEVRKNMDTGSKWFYKGFARNFGIESLDKFRT